MRAALKVLFILVALGAASCGRPDGVPTVVLVVRHAEKASDAEDSPLTEAGAQRAQALARLAEGAGVSAVYSSQFRRNLDTVKPFAERAGINVAQAPVNLQSPGGYGKALAADILDKHAGRTVLVVGHANTVGATVEALAGRPAPPGDVQYGDLFVVVVPRAGAPMSLKAQYGM